MSLFQRTVLLLLVAILRRSIMGSPAPATEGEDDLIDVATKIVGFPER